MYRWRDDIVDLNDGDGLVANFLSQEFADTAAWLCASRIARENDSDAQEEMANIIGLWGVSRSSKLFGLLKEWHGCDGDGLLDKVRDSVYVHGYLCFVTGCNYAIWDADLLGGSGTNEAKMRFDEFVEERCGRQ